MPLKAAPVWALLGPGAKEYPANWGVRVDVTNLVTSGVTKMYLYGEIGPWGVRASDVIEALQEISGAVEVHINSMGGSVFEGLAIYQALAEHSGGVDVVIDGLAASAASFIAMAGRTIEIGQAAHMMIHNASSGCYGDAREMEATAIMLRNCSTAIAGLYAKRSGLPTETFTTAMDVETWYIGQEAVDAGLADRVRGDEDEDEPEFPDNIARNEASFDLSTLPDPPVTRQADGPDSTEEEPQRERPVETDGNTPKSNADEEELVGDPPDDEAEIDEGFTWDHLEDAAMFAWLDKETPAGVLDHLMEGAAQ